MSVENHVAELMLVLLTCGALFFGTAFLWGFCFPPKIKGFRRWPVFVFGLCAVTATSLFLIVFLLGAIQEVGRSDSNFLNVIGISLSMTLYIMANIWWGVLAPAVLIASLGLELARRHRLKAENRDLTVDTINS